MSRSKILLALVFLPILTPGSVQPQQPTAVPQSPSALTGSVTGFVYYGETRLPARFAEIHVVPVPSEADLDAAKDKPTVPNAPQQRDRRVHLARGVSDMDGSFRIDGIPAGDYLIAAIKPGYAMPGAAAATNWNLSEAQLKDLIASVPQVHVAVGQTASVNLTLHRGAVIAGRMQFADGSPVIGAMFGCEPVESVPLPENRLRVPSLLQDALITLASSQDDPAARRLTDDEGQYRIAGLSPGKYIVTTMMSMVHNSASVVMKDGNNLRSGGREHMFPEMIAVYAPGTFRRTDVKVFEIRGDEQITNADLTINPNGMHILRGRVLAAEDRHSPFAMVRLREDDRKVIDRLAEIEDDGSFQINYLPSGKYTILIMAYDAPDLTNSNDGPKEPRSYKTVKLTAVIGDHDAVLDDVL